MKKVKFSLFQRSKIRPVWLLVISCLILFVIFFLSEKKWLVVIPCAILLAFFLIKRYIMKPLILSDGEVVYLYGLPGSGKTMTMTRIAKDNYAHRLIVANEEYSHCRLAGAVMPSSQIGQFDFPVPALFCNDESMLDSFGSRSYSTNFEDERKQEFIVKIRQYGHSMVFTSQRQNALDIMLREGIISRWYFCSDGALFSRAEMLIKDYAVSEVTGMPQEYYRFPTFFEWLKDPSLRLYSFKPFFGKFYSTRNPSPLPIYPFIDINEM